MDRIRQLRKERGLSQVKLAVMADMDPATLNRLERGTGNPNLKTLQRIAGALDVSVAEVLEDVSPKVSDRSSLEPSLLNGLEEERRSSILADAVAAAADTWIAAVTDSDINIHKRFGIRDAAIELFDRINARALEEWQTGDTKRRREIGQEIGQAMGKLNEIPEEAYRAMPDETLKEAVEERRRKMREWTRRISA